VFVHGAMCVSISGRCLLSAYLYGQSSNCGACAQPCRKEWILSDNEGNQVSNFGKYFLSAKDLCMIEFIPDLIKLELMLLRLKVGCVTLNILKLPLVVTEKPLIPILTIPLLEKSVKMEARFKRGLQSRLFNRVLFWNTG